MRPIIYSALLAISLAAGCAGSGNVGYRATVSATSPDLVYVGPGVYVIADYHEPIFYSNDSYWRYDRGNWYRSHTYTGGWSYANPPGSLLRIDRPYAYVRYRPRGYVSRRYRDDRRPAYRQSGPVVRDHRYDRPVRDDRSYQQRPVTRSGPRSRVVQPRGPVQVERRDERREERDDDRRRSRRSSDDRDERGRPVVRDHR